MDRAKERLRMGLDDVEMFASIDQGQLDALTDALVKAKRIFVAGWGRAGNCVKILSMDCSQIGLTTYVVGDNSTPSIQQGDILVIGSGSGETKTMAVLARQCKKHGATLGLISGNAESTIGKLADVNVVIPTKKWNPEAPAASGGSFYHVMVMTVDILRVYMAEALGVTNQDIHNNHNNLE
jgi:6-phospho-3-hexuloisomerase